MHSSTRASMPHCSAGCSTPDRAASRPNASSLIGKERGDAFLEQFTAKMASLRAGSPDDAATTLGPISSERALDLLLKQIDQARQGGAKVALGGHRIDRPGFYIEPTILTGIDKGNPV